MPEVFGWKTSPIHWNDDAVFQDVDYWAIPRPGDWRELVVDGFSRDMAFVITPEPATIALLGFGAVGLLARRRRK